MNILVAVTAHNLYLTGRSELCYRTIQSLNEAFHGCVRYLLHNGSTDGSECIHPPGWIVEHRRQEPTTPGAGRNHALAWIKTQTPDVIVFSDDDMVWRPGAQDALKAIWAAAPDELAVVGGLLEPVYPWNTPRRVLHVGGHKVLLRDSTPGAAWSCRAPGAPFEPMFEPVFGYDVIQCKKLQAAEQLVGQVDLAEHIGWGFSTHGNDMHASTDQKPLDKERWGL